MLSNTVYDSVLFGKYPSNYVNSTEPLVWLVLDVKDGRALLIAEDAIDAMSYHRNLWGHPTWETSDLRKWLNSEFLNQAFTPREQSFICPTVLANHNNPKYDTYGGNSTVDKIFCLSAEEAEHYFSGCDSWCSPTNYALSKKAAKYEGKCRWWLRTPGDNEFCVMYVDECGRPSIKGDVLGFPDITVRPAMWVSLNVITNNKML